MEGFLGIKGRVAYLSEQVERALVRSGGDEKRRAAAGRSVQGRSRGPAWRQGGGLSADRAAATLLEHRSSVHGFTVTDTGADGRQRNRRAGVSRQRPASVRDNIFSTKRSCSS